MTTSVDTDKTGLGVNLASPGAIGGTTPAAGTFTNLTISGGTVTDNLLLINASVTWNDAAETFTAIKLNVTSTASAAASILMDLQVGGTSQFKVDKSGNITMSNGAYIAGIAAVEIRAASGNVVIFRTGPTTEMARFDPAGLQFLNGGYIQMKEQTAPSAPSANNVRLYAVDNGAGKTQLMALFGSGAAQQVAIEP